MLDTPRPTVLPLLNGPSAVRSSLEWEVVSKPWVLKRLTLRACLLL